jgi:hypothetical protein
MSKKVLALFAVALVLSLIAAQCAPAPTPETIVETVVVEKEVEVEKEVIKEVEVEVPVGGEVTNITVWAQAADVEHWRADAPMKAAPLVNGTGEPMLR